MQLTKEFWSQYLPLLSKSIRVQTNTDDPENFIRAKGWGESTQVSQMPWAARVNNWKASNDVDFYSVYADKLVSDGATHDYHSCIPLFPNLVRKCSVRAAQASNNQKQDTPMKDTMNKVLDTNKQAVQIAAKLATGKTANSFFLNKLLGKFPWYAKVFSKKNDMVNNPIAKIVAAQTALTLVTHFAPNNKKLNYITEGMVQEALVDVTVNSAALEKMIGELENLVTLPDFDA